MPKISIVYRILVVVFLFILILACKKNSSPDEEQFKQIVTQLVVDAANRSGGKVDGKDPIKTIVLDSFFLPSNSVLTKLIKQNLSKSGISWIEENLHGSLDNLPGDWTTFGENSNVRYNRTHSLLSLEITNTNGNRLVKWRLSCGSLCGFGEDVRCRWTGNRWEYKTIAYIRF